jgi:type IV fimbrial biogenesis protein FimT
MRHKESGFNIFELMVAIAIFAILSAIAVPSFIGWLPKYRLSTAARDVLSALEHAKGAAVRENANVVVQFTMATGQYQIFVDNGEGGGTPADWARNGTERIVRRGNMPAGITITAVTFFNDRVRFNNGGLPQTQPDPPAALNGGTVTVANSTDTRNIVLTMGGSTRIQ